MSTEQIAVRIPSEQLVVLDDIVARGLYPSRAAAVRAGLDAILELDRRQRLDHAVVAGYLAVPPAAAERSAATASLRDAISEEPW